MRRRRRSAAPPCLFAARSSPELGEVVRKPGPYHISPLSLCRSISPAIPHRSRGSPLAAERPPPATAAPPGPPSRVPRRPFTLPGLTPPRTEPRSTVFGVLRRSAAARPSRPLRLAPSRAVARAASQAAVRLSRRPSRAEPQLSQQPRLKPPPPCFSH